MGGRSLVALKQLQCSKSTFEGLVRERQKESRGVYLSGRLEERTQGGFAEQGVIKRLFIPSRMFEKKLRFDQDGGENKRQRWKEAAAFLCGQGGFHNQGVNVPGKGS